MIALLFFFALQLKKIYIYFIFYHQVLKFQSVEYFEECKTEQVPRKIQEKKLVFLPIAVCDFVVMLSRIGGKTFGHRFFS